MAAAVVMLVAASATTASQGVGGTVVAFPEGYREWVHVKSALVSARHPDFQRSGGFRHIYANPKALTGYRVDPMGRTIAYRKGAVGTDENTVVASVPLGRTWTPFRVVGDGNAKASALLLLLISAAVLFRRTA